MNTDRDDCPRASRRVVLIGTALALGNVSQALAQVKISQSTAKYQNTPKDDQRCDRCVNLQPPNARKFVEGNIRPSGWCQLFVKKT
jgi:hypothetical protein